MKQFKWAVCGIFTVLTAVLFLACNNPAGSFFVPEINGMNGSVWRYSEKSGDLSTVMMVNFSKTKVVVSTIESLKGEIKNDAKKEFSYTYDKKNRTGKIDGDSFTVSGNRKQLTFRERVYDLQ
jgi:hypothetical protein